MLIVQSNEDLSGWRYVVRGPGRPSFYRSRHRPLAGDWVGRLLYGNEETGGESRLVLTPPRPMPIPVSDRVQIWVRGNRVRSGSTPTVALRVLDAAGAVHRLPFPAADYIFWAPLDMGLSPGLSRPLQFAGLEIRGLGTDPGQTQELCFDDLAFYVEDPAPIPLTPPDDLPFPTRPETLLPTVKSEVVNTLRPDNGEWIFEGTGGGTTTRFVFRPKTGTLDDLFFSIDDGERFPVASGGGPTFEIGGELLKPGDASLTCTLEVVERTAGGLRVRWRVRLGSENATLTYSLRMLGRSLLVGVASGRGVVAEFAAGTPELEGIRPLAVPYLFYGQKPDEAEPCVRYTEDGLFISHLRDYYNSDATALLGISRAGDAASVTALERAGRQVRRQSQALEGGWLTLKAEGAAFSLVVEPTAE